MEINYEVYRGKAILGYHETLKEATFNAQMASIVKPGIVTVYDKHTGEVVAKYEEGYKDVSDQVSSAK